MGSHAGCERRSDAMGFTAFAGHKYLNLETFKKDGMGVKTPVWFAADSSSSLDANDARLYVYTIGVSGKVKRIRNYPRVKIAPCDMLGTVLGARVDAQAQTGIGGEDATGVQLINTT